jgi:hypothetical protein
MTFHRRNIEKPAKTVRVPCDRCGGSGVFVWGTCFRCGGGETDPTHREWAFPTAWTDEQCQAWTDARNARNERARERARTARLAAKADASAAAEAAKAVACPSRLHMSDLAASGDSKAHQTLASIMAGNRLSEAQMAFCLRLTQDIIDREIHGAPEMTLGRQVIEATIVKHDSKVTQFGVREVVTLKTANGAILWGTCPKQWFHAEPGQTVKMTATIEQGWAPGCFKFSRPTKAVVTINVEGGAE